MNKKTKNIILLVISGVFLIVASVLVTYTIMNYVNFKNRVLENGGNPEEVIKEEKKTPISNAEMEEFVQAMNTRTMSNFLSSVSFLKLTDLNISNSNLIKYVYPLFNGCDNSNLPSVVISKDNFISEFYNLSGKQLDDATIENSSLWNTEIGSIVFTLDDKEMSASIKISSSYKVDDEYYFDLDIDNSIYGAMKRSVALNRNDANKYTFMYIKSTN